MTKVHMTAAEILKWWDSNKQSPIFGYMYGEPYIHTSMMNGEDMYVRGEIVCIQKHMLKISDRRDCFMFVWGFPGPDFNIYKFEDYGRTWAFRREDIKVPSMKIIKPGDINLLKATKRFMCKKCGCIFEADKGEYRSDSQYNEIYYISTCPTCGSPTYSGE